MRNSLLVLVVALLLAVNIRAQSVDALPTLSGQEAIEQLKRTGGDESLKEAMEAARQRDGQSNEPRAPEADGQKLVASDGAAYDFFGFSVAISGDTAIVGAYGIDVGANTNQGAAYVFIRNGTTWTQQAKLVAADGAANDNFGRSVAISGDTAIVGAFLKDVGANAEQGAAYVFVRNGTTWTQQTELLAPDGAAYNHFGKSVAISGATTVIGADGDKVGTTGNRGSAYVFVRNGTTWTQQAKLVAADGAAGDFFGVSVAISGDTAIVGASAKDSGANTNQGAAYVFVRNGTTWTQQAKLVAADGAAGDKFGISVAISGDTAIVGAHGKTVGANTDQGAAYIFVRNGTTWMQQAKLVAADGARNDNFGVSVAVSGDTAIVGALFDGVGENVNQGSAYVFVRSGTTWTLQRQLIAADGAANDYFGSSVAISGDMAIVGAHQNAAEGIPGRGSAYVFNTPVSTSNTPTGSNVTVQSSSGDARVTFSQVTSAGNTTFTPINPPSSAGTPPRGYTILDNAPAYDITTTAVYTPPVTVCFTVSSITTQAEFSRARILHGENGQLIDRTILAPDSPAPDFATRKVCARVNSLSPFVAALAPTAPTAASVSVGGRVTTAAGRGISKAIVSVTDGSGNVLTTTTNSFGYYSFAGLPAGGIYVFSVRAKRYQFAQPSQVLSINDEQNDVNFTAFPEQREFR